jgi:hypothetical protein
MFSCYAPPDPIWAEPRASSPVFMFRTPELLFDFTDGFECRFHVLCSRSCFRRYRGRRVPFSCFAIPDSFPAVPRTSGPICMFGAPGHVFRGTKALLDSFSTVKRVSDPVLMLCAPRLVFNGTENDGSRLHVLRSRTRFGRYRGRRVQFPCLHSRIHLGRK